MPPSTKAQSPLTNIGEDGEGGGVGGSGGSDGGIGGIGGSGGGIGGIGGDGGHESFAQSHPVQVQLYELSSCEQV